MSTLIFTFLVFLQNVAFSLVSRSRNRDNVYYHAFASILSTTAWYFTFKHLVVNDMELSLFIPYLIGTLGGSIWGVKISMWIERKLDARSDGHLKGNN